MKFAYLRTSTILLFLLICVSVMALEGYATERTATIAKLSEVEIANGHVTVLEIDLSNRGAKATQPRARIDQREIALFQHPVKPAGFYCGLIGIPISSAPQKTAIRLEWQESGGRRQTAEVFLNIIEGNYKKEALQVAPRHVTPSPKNLERIKTEKAEIRRIYATGSETRLWNGNFIKPLTSRTTSVFGTQRLFNGKLQSYHRGTDLRAKTGTPINASNSGVVRLAKDLFYSGNIVIIDHGNGIFTNYAHLSQIQVRPGQHVARGHQIGLSGATGRVNGPHLHWGVKVNGVYVDPLQFIITISDILAQ